MGRASKNSTLYVWVIPNNPYLFGHLPAYLDNQELLSFPQLATQLHPSLLLLVLDLLILMTVMMMTMMIIMNRMMTMILH